MYNYSHQIFHVELTDKIGYSARSQWTFPTCTTELYSHFRICNRLVYEKKPLATERHEIDDGGKPKTRTRERLVISVSDTYERSPADGAGYAKFRL